jgi:hypothetical protein
MTPKTNKLTDDLYRALRSLEWGGNRGDSKGDYCHSCCAYRSDGHRDYCRVDAALAQYRTVVAAHELVAPSGS